MTDSNTLVAYSYFMHSSILKAVGEKWEPYVTRTMSFWHQHLSNQGIFRYTRDFGVPDEPRHLVLIIGSTETHLFGRKGFEQTEGNVVLNAVCGVARMKRLEDIFKREANTLFRLLEACLCNLTVDSWKQFYRHYSKFCSTLHITAILGRVGLTALEERLRELSYSESEVPEIISVITYPSEHTPLFLSQRELYEIAKARNDGLSDEELQARSAQWLARHSHIPVNFCEEPWMHQDISQRLEAIERGREGEMLKRLKAEHRRKCKEARATLRRIDDRRVSELAVTISKGTILNEFRKNVFSRVSLEYRPIFETVALKCGGTNWRECWFMTAEEMGQVIGGESVPLVALKKEREVVAFYNDERGEIAFLNKESTKRVYDFVQQFRGKESESVESSNREVRGFSASKGAVTGLVKVVFGSKDFAKVERGDILVAIMTSVDFIPVMERAAAFVTNEGGITSHASIVAREMGKPCIIGTKIATKVLKDGDLVEVNANEGVVKIITRAGE